MSNKKTILRIFVVFITLFVIVLIVFFLFRAYRYFKTEDKTVFAVINNETAVVVKCDNLMAVNELRNSNPSYLKLFLFPENNKYINSFLDFTLSQDYMNHIVETCPIYMIINSKSEKWYYIYAWEIGKKNNKAIKQFLTISTTKFKTKKLSYKQWEIYKMMVGDRVVYFTYYNGLVLFGLNEQQIYISLNQLLLPEKNPFHLLGDLLCKWDRSTAFHILIQNDVLENGMKTNKSIFSDDIILKYSSIYYQSALDVHFREGKIIFSGYTILDSNNSSFYTCRSSYPNYYKLLPNNLSSVFALFGDNFQKLTSLYSTKVGSNEDFFTMMQPNSIITFTCQHDTTVNYILMRSDDITEAAFHLFNCLNSTYEKNVYHLDTSYFNGFMIGKIDIPNFFIGRMELCTEMKRLKAYTIMDNCILFSDSDIYIRNYISDIKNNRLIINDSNFVHDDLYFQEAANLMYYKIMGNSNLTGNGFQKKIHSFRLQLNYFKNNTMFFTLLLVPK